MRYVPHLQHHAVGGGVNNFKYIVKAMQTGYDTVVTKSQKETSSLKIKNTVLSRCYVL